MASPRSRSHPPRTLEYRSGLDEPSTDWKGGFALLELIVENLLGLFFAASGTICGAFGAIALVSVLISHSRRNDPIAAAGTFIIMSIASAILFFLARQFIGVRVRR
ncbi:MAG TPA: hypothetical protein VH475_23230 [Tepidisphaeraceae bacterium]|jgi:hypothetical protein